MQELLLIENPRRRRRRRRNPQGGIMKGLGVKSISREWFAGMDLMDMGAAVGGLAASTMIPGRIVTVAETTGQKIMKIAVAFACAAGAGFLARNISLTAGKYAVAGGVAGALSQTLGAFTNVDIGKPSMRYISRGRGLGIPFTTPSGNESNVQVSVT